MTDFCNRDIQTTITLFKRITSSHNTDGTLLTQLPDLPWLLYYKVNSLKNVERSWNVYKSLFTLIIELLLVYFCLFVYQFFMLMFVVILNSTIICKKVSWLYSFVFVAFVYNFNIKGCKSKTPVFRFFIFILFKVLRNFNIRNFFCY